MFDEFMSPKDRASIAVDTYLERMEKALKIKKLAKELGESVFDKEMTEMIKTLVHMTTIEAKEGVREYEEESNV